jgi:hypothetical protein
MLTVPTLSIIATLGLFELTKSFQLPHKTSCLGLAIATAALFYIAKDEWHINQPLFPREVAGDAIDGSTTWAHEQAAIWFVPKPTTIPPTKVNILDGKGTFMVQSWKTPRHEYTVQLSAPTLVEENTMYYPGWKAYVDGQEVQIDYQSTQFPGRLVFPVPAGSHTITTRLTETPLRMTVDIVSFVSIIGVGSILVFRTVRAIRH